MAVAQRMMLTAMNLPYRNFGLELLVEGVIMYFVMYAMVDRFAYVYINANNFYMTLMMVAPMGMVMLYSMRGMFQDKALNRRLYLFFALLFLISFYAMRAQALVGDRQFLRSMIPHHSGAILMCRRAWISDPEIMDLCDTIISSQQNEIDQMEEILRRL